ncbi:unnamed protein product [Symbiodinium sp. CCMP2592]|nr:unnamed protein product [Symbiodinium sp. CCMP2592]
MEDAAGFDDEAGHLDHVGGPTAQDLRHPLGHLCSGGVTELRWALLLIPIGAAAVGPELQLLDLSDCKQAFFLVGRRQWSDRQDAQRALLHMVCFADCFRLLAFDRAGVPGWVHLGYVLNKANIKDAICQLLQTKAEQGAATFLRCLQMFKAAVSKQAPLATLGNQIVDGDVLEDCISAVRAGCDFPLPPPLLEGGREDSDLDKEIAAAVAEPSPLVSDALEMLFLRLEPDYLTVVKVQPTAERNVDGYQHLLCVKDVWSQLSMATSFFAWYSKNESSGTLKQHADSWGLSRKHIVRHENYKGSQEAFTWPGLKYDCVSSAGFLLLIGTLAQIRGLAENVQSRCVSLLRRMTGLLEFSDGLKLLPTLTLAVQDGQVMLKSFLKLFDRELRASLKQRWENCVALGTSRKNLGGYVPVADVCWFLMRLRADSDGLSQVPVTRLQKRILHILAQAWESGMCDGSIHLRDTPPRQQEEPGQTPWSSGLRTRNANLARQELLKRFLARGGGFVTGLRNRSNSEICPTDLELPGTLGKSLGACAAHQYLTGYFLDARSALMKKLSVQKFRHMSMYEDAAKVGTYEVLQVLVSADGLMISSPISLLPQLKETTESSAAENLAKAAELVPKKALQDLKGAKASCGPATLSAPEKVATRSKLLAINHSLNALIDYRLADSLPPHAFRPCRNGERRSTVHWNGLDLPYVWSPTGVTWQTTQYPGWQSILRLNCLQDEGDAAGAYQMAQNGLAVLVHRDTLHKLHREEILASSEVAEIALARKQINLVLKFDRAPWATSAFGRRLAEARDRVGEIPTDHPLIDMVSAGIISDLGLSPDASPAQVKEAILAFCRSKRGSTGAEHKTGRWCDLLDSFRRLRSEWHCRLFVLLFAMILEGRNPWSALSESLDKAGSDDDVALAPKVLRVREDKSVEGSLRLRSYVVKHWPDLIRDTLKSALSPESIQDLICNVDDTEQLLAVHWRHTIATVQRFWDYSTLYQFFPWRFFMLLDCNPDVANRCLKEMESEWVFLCRMEEKCRDASDQYPLKAVPHVRWHVYREVMTYCQERRWRLTDDLKDLVRAWLADPSSTLGCENCFRSLRLGERGQSGGEIAPVQLQTASIQAVAERYENFETISPSPSLVHSVPMKQVIKTSIFTAKRDTAADTGLENFNAIAREAATSPYHFNRKALNVWSTCKRLDGDMSRTWVTELARPAQVWQCRQDLFLVVDAPYVVLRVCSLLKQTKVVDGQNHHVAVIPTSAFQMKDINPADPDDWFLLPAEPMLLNAREMVLKLGDPQPIINYALENYACRALAVHQFGTLVDGLSANALRMLCTAKGSPAKGNMTKKATCEHLLKHMGYDEGKAASILATFKQTTKATEEMENDDDIDDPGGNSAVLGMDTVCEAELLSKLLSRMEKKETDATAAPQNDKASASAPPSKRAKTSRADAAQHGQSSVIPWPAEERGSKEGAASILEVPPGCRIGHNAPLAASPFLQGFLPEGQVWRNGKNSISRAYKPASTSSTVSIRVARSYDQAKAEVSEWLWSWWEAKGKPGCGTEAETSEPPARPAKQQKK